MKRLILMCHAETLLSGYDPGPQTPLSPDGTRAATVAGQFLAAYAIDLVLVAPTTYAVQTWEAACLGGVWAAKVELIDWLSDPLGRQLEPLVLSLPDKISTVLLIGREPGLHSLAFGLLRPFQSAFDELPPASIFVMQHEREWYNMPGAAKKETYKYIEAPRR